MSELSEILVGSTNFTNTDTNVKQTATTGNANYEVLFSNTADNTTRTEGARKASNLTFNPSTGNLTATKFTGDISEGTGLTDTQVTTALGYDPQPTKTASGAIATFSDGADLPMPSFICNIDAVQDLHGYDAPWVGGSGKNKLQVTATSKTINGVTFTVNSDGTIKANGTATANADLWLHNSYGSTDAFVGVGDYIVNCAGSKSGIQLQFGYSQSVYRTIESESDTSISVSNNGISWVLLRVTQGTSVNDNLIKPMIRLSTETDPTFAPYSNICPISGHTEVNVSVSGVNVWDEEWEVGNINDGSGEDLPQDNVIRSKGYIRVMSGDSYYIKCPTTGISRLFLYTKDKSYITYVPIANITNNTYTIPNNCEYIRFRTLAAYGTTYNNDISINYPSTDTEYHAYNPNSQTIQVSWQTEAGEVFGGYVDLVSGVLTVDRKVIILDGSQRVSFTQFGSNYRSAYAVDDATKIYYDNQLANVKCDRYPTIAYDTAGSAPMGGVSLRYNIAQINVFQNQYTTYQDWNAYLESNPMKVVYELATPITYQLTPTQIKSLLGTNNAWCSTGDVDVKYITQPYTDFSTKQYVDDAIATAITDALNASY